MHNAASAPAESALISMRETLDAGQTVRVVVSASSQERHDHSGMQAGMEKSAMKVQD